MSDGVGYFDFEITGDIEALLNIESGDMNSYFKQR